MCYTRGQRSHRHWLVQSKSELLNNGLNEGKMHLETSSNLYGVTVNPFNRDLTSGGSSGGEGALIGLRGSCIGIGSDIGVCVVEHMSLRSDFDLD